MRQVLQPSSSLHTYDVGPQLLAIRQQAGDVEKSAAGRLFVVSDSCGQHPFSRLD